MEITHCRFQLRVSHRQLDGAGIRAAIQAVGGVGVAEFMRQYHNAKLAASLFDTLFGGWARG